jgi:hypothetical protein
MPRTPFSPSVVPVYAVKQNWLCGPRCASAFGLSESVAQNILLLRRFPVPPGKRG